MVPETPPLRRSCNPSVLASCKRMKLLQDCVGDRSAATPIRPGSPTRPNKWSWNRVNGPWDSLAVLDWIDSCRHLWTRCAFANSKKSVNPGTWDGRSRRSARLGRRRSPPARFDCWRIRCDLGRLARIRGRSRHSMRVSLLNPMPARIYTWEIRCRPRPPMGWVTDSDREEVRGCTGVLVGRLRMWR